MPISIRACSIAAVAWLSEAPGVRLKLSVAAGALRLVIHRQRNPLASRSASPPSAEPRPRRALHVDVLQRVRILLELLRHLHHHVVLVQRSCTWSRPASGRTHPRASHRSSAATPQAGLPYRDRSPAAPAGPCPADRSPRPSAPAASASPPSASAPTRSGPPGCLARQRVLILRRRPPSADVQLLLRLQIQLHARNARSLRPQAGSGSPLPSRRSSARSASGFRNMNMLRRVDRRRRPARRRPETPSRSARPGSFCTMLDEQHRLLLRWRRRHILLPANVAADAARVLLREESLRHQDVQVDIQARRSAP